MRSRYTPCVPCESTPIKEIKKMIAAPIRKNPMILKIVFLLILSLKKGTLSRFVRRILLLPHLAI
jgi:hypothetical protein